MRMPLRDYSALANHARLEGGVYETQSGIIGSSLGLAVDTANGMATVPQHASYALSGAFFIEGLARRGRAPAADSEYLAGGPLFRVNTYNGASLYGACGGYQVISSVPTPNNQIFSWAFGREANGTLRVFVDGIMTAVSPPLVAVSAGAITIGNTRTGYLIDEIRFTNGVCRYSNSYTPSYDAFPEGATLDPHWANVVFLSHGDPVPEPAYTTGGAAARNEPSVTAMAGALLTGGITARDVAQRVVFGGAGRITGTTKNQGTPNVPVARRVRLYDERSGLFIAETWSDDVTGAYAFDNLRMGELYTVLSLDHTQTYRAVVADRVLPAL